MLEEDESASSEGYGLLEALLVGLRQRLIEKGDMAQLAELASAYGHEVANFSTVLDGAYALVDRELGSHGASRPHVAAVLESAKNVLERGRRLRDYVGRQTPGATLFDLNSLLREVSPLLELLTQCSVSFDTHPGELHVRVDATVLSQLVLELGERVSPPERAGSVVGLSTEIEQSVDKTHTIVILRILGPEPPRDCESHGTEPTILEYASISEFARALAELTGIEIAEVGDAGYELRLPQASDATG